MSRNDTLKWRIVSSPEDFCLLLPISLLSFQALPAANYCQVLIRSSLESSLVALGRRGGRRIMATPRKIRVHGGRCVALSLSRSGKIVFCPQRSLRLRGTCIYGPQLFWSLWSSSRSDLVRSTAIFMALRGHVTSTISDANNGQHNPQ